MKLWVLQLYWSAVIYSSYTFLDRPRLEDFLYQVIFFIHLSIFWACTWHLQTLTTKTVWLTINMHPWLWLWACERLISWSCSVAHLIVRVSIARLLVAIRSRPLLSLKQTYNHVPVYVAAAGTLLVGLWLIHSQLHASFHARGQFKTEADLFQGPGTLYFNGGRHHF